jgi:hypothetical protein
VPQKHLKVKQMLDQWRGPISEAMKSGASVVPGSSFHSETVANPLPTTVNVETKR